MKTFQLLSGAISLIREEKNHKGNVEYMEKHGFKLRTSYEGGDIFQKKEGSEPVDLTKGEAETFISILNLQHDDRNGQSQLVFQVAPNLRCVTKFFKHTLKGKMVTYYTYLEKNNWNPFEEEETTATWEIKKA